MRCQSCACPPHSISLQSWPDHLNFRCAMQAGGPMPCSASPPAAALVLSGRVWPSCCPMTSRQGLVLDWGAVFSMAGWPEALTESYDLVP